MIQPQAFYPDFSTPAFSTMNSSTVQPQTSIVLNMVDMVENFEVEKSAVEMSFNPGVLGFMVKKAGVEVLGLKCPETCEKVPGHFNPG